VPIKFERRVDEVKSMPSHRRFERIPLKVVVAIDAKERCLKAAERIKRLCLGDVACMNDAIDTRIVEEINDAPDILQVVMRVADDTDAQMSAPLRSGGFLENVYAASAAEADDMREAEARAFDLPVSGFATQMR